MTRKQRGPLVVGRQVCVSGYITHLMADSLLSTDTAEQDSLSSQATEYKEVTRRQRVTTYICTVNCKKKLF